VNYAASHTLLIHKRSYAIGDRVSEADGRLNSTANTTATPDRTEKTVAAPARTDKDALHGRCEIAAAAFEGRYFKPDELKRVQFDELVFKGDSLQMRSAADAGSLWYYNFKLEDRHDPKQITVFGSEPQGKSTFRGIYALAGDTLEHCLNRDGTAVSRP